MGKKVLILSGSPRKGGNSDTLCDQFLLGAADAGNEAEKIFIRDKNIKYCLACGTCYAKKEACVHHDDMTGIIEKMINADVIVMATPAYFYAMSGQMKVLIDRTIARFLEIRDKDMYFILTAHNDEKASAERVMEGFKGYMACLPGAKEKGVVYGLGVFDAGEIKTHPAMQEAYETGKSV
ncbi:MAG: flavodoxin family protein [Acidobacteriota bacterium]|jgi:multimeric flavodoxin WrbA|nr:flavodoxin family protein [Acidobacteriota bacterium]